MLRADLLRRLRCPESHQPLSLSDPSLVGKLNRHISAGQLRNRAGQLVTEEIQGGLVRADSKYLYPIRQGIPIMLVDEAIPLSV